ncbi:MAG: hypothetical protein L0Z53_05380 [Acidobacteriales bacterium]|nr:hypothetical protein [Terriglobales bacterium]
MHSEETKLKFIELRAREQTLDDISIALNVCRRTLIHWNRELADDIADLREVEREALRRKLFGNTHDWMKGELDHYQRLDKELARREFKYSPTESVFRMRAETRKTIEKFLFAESSLDRPRQSPIRSDESHTRAETTSSAPQADGRAAAPSGAVSDAEISNAESETSSASVQPVPNQSPGLSPAKGLNVVEDALD